jgi:hypothetical protein
MTNPFSGIGQTKASRDANYVNPGGYIMRIDSVRMKKNRKDGPIFVIELTPLHVLREESTLMNGVDVKSNRLGVGCTHLIPFTGPGAEMALPNIKAFAETVIPGFAEAGGKEQEEALALVTGDEQPLAGMMVEITARPIVTRSKKDFTKVNYVEVVDDAARLKRELITQEEFDLLSQARPA